MHIAKRMHRKHRSSRSTDEPDELLARRAARLPASVEAQNNAHRPSVSACQLSNGAERLWRIGSRVWATPARMPPPAASLGEAATTTRRAGAPDGGGRVLT